MNHSQITTMSYIVYYCLSMLFEWGPNIDKFMSVMKLMQLLSSCQIIMFDFLSTLRLFRLSWVDTTNNWIYEILYSHSDIFTYFWLVTLCHIICHKLPGAREMQIQNSCRNHLSNSCMWISYKTLVHDFFLWNIWVKCSWCIIDDIFLFSFWVAW